MGTSSWSPLVDSCVSAAEGALVIAVPEAQPFIGSLNSMLGVIAPQYFGSSNAYAQALSEQIAQLQEIVVQDFAQLTGMVQQVQSSLQQILDAIKGLELETQLVQYENARAVVVEYYDDYNDYVSALSTPGTNTQQVAGQLYTLLTGNADDVATALMDITSAVLNGPDDTAGIIARQAFVVQQQVQEWIADTSNYPGPGFTGSNGEKYFSGSYDAQAIFSQAYPQGAEAAASSYVVPVLQAILGIYGQGLTFLTSAWAGSDQESNLQTHLDNLADIVSAIGDLQTTLGTADTIDGAVQPALVTTPAPRVPTIQPQEQGSEATIELKDWGWWSAADSSWTVIQIPNDDRLSVGATYDVYLLKPVVLKPAPGDTLHLLGAFPQDKLTVPAASSVVQDPIPAAINTLVSQLPQISSTSSGDAVLLEDFNE